MPRAAAKAQEVLGAVEVETLVSTQAQISIWLAVAAAVVPAVAAVKLPKSVLVAAAVAAVAAVPQVTSIGVSLPAPQIHGTMQELKVVVEVEMVMIRRHPEVLILTCHTLMMRITQEVSEIRITRSGTAIGKKVINGMTVALAVAEVHRVIISLLMIMTTS